MRRIRASVLSIVLASSIILFMSACQSTKSTSTNTVTIAVPYKKGLSEINEGYYKHWLEEQTGLKIEFAFIPEAYQQEYMHMLLTGQSTQVDAVFFSQDSIMTQGDINAYGTQGKIYPLGDLIDNQSIYLSHAFEVHTPYDLKEIISDFDGEIYYMPALDRSETSTTFQTMWISEDWLKQAGLTIPTTTAEFRETLNAFLKLYPSYPPLIGSIESESDFACNFLMNSFTICDPENSYMAIKNGEIYFPPKTNEWRDGLRYCNMLYKESLLVPQNFTYKDNQFISICNDPRNIVGVFCSKGMSDVLSRQSPELLSKYLAVHPLTSPLKSGTSIVQVPRPRPGGIILASSQNKEDVFRLMDLMCSENGFLSGHYGEQGVDWDFSTVGEISANGNPAKITVKKQAVAKHTPKRIVVGPYITSAKYSDNVAWKGYQVNQSEYLEARAFRMYERYETDESIAAIIFTENKAEHEQSLSAIREYTKSSMIDFITGTLDIENDEVWQSYVDGFGTYNLEDIILTIQKEHY